jgi:hypothetical protein
LLTRTGDGFGFVHRSVLEWLVADDAAARLVAGERPSSLDARPMSDLMTDFFCDLAGRARAVAWARSALGAGSRDWTPVGQGNATRVLARVERRRSESLPPYLGKSPDFVEERDLAMPPFDVEEDVDSLLDVTPEDDLYSAVDSRLDEAPDFTGLDWRDQDLAAFSGQLQGARLAGTTWTGLQVSDFDLRGADLRGADLTRTRFTNVGPDRART